ncbi:MAG: hypothetical protein PHR62_15385 [Paludibacter sp.]|nr:hypothetical protein [Paludibacter sp.]
MKLLRLFLCTVLLFGAVGCSNSSTVSSEEDNTDYYNSDNVSQFADLYPEIYETIILNNVDFKACLNLDSVELYPDANLRLNTIQVFNDFGDVYASFSPNEDIMVNYYYDIDTRKMWLIDIEMFNPDLKDTLITTAMYMVYDDFSTSDESLSEISAALASDEETNVKIEDGKYEASHYIKESSERFCISIF